MAVAAKELSRTFVGTELEEELAGLAPEKDVLLREISEYFWGTP